jgi:hypothetical protein
MSSIIGGIVAGITTFAAVTVAAIPEAKEALSPLFEPGQEYAVVSAAIFFTVQGLVMLALLAKD